MNLSIIWMRKTEAWRRAGIQWTSQCWGLELSKYLSKLTGWAIAKQVQHALERLMKTTSAGREEGLSWDPSPKWVPRYQ
jgi:hypothetical protein